MVCSFNDVYLLYGLTDNVLGKANTGVINYLAPLLLSCEVVFPTGKACSQLGWPREYAFYPHTDVGYTFLRGMLFWVLC